MLKQLPIVVGVLLLFIAVYFKIYPELIAPVIWRSALTPLHKISIDEMYRSDKCDRTLWNHIYLPQRLEVIEPCVELVGVLTKVEKESDGDNHLLIKLDPQFSNTTNIFNKVLMNGYLITEIVCLDEQEFGEAEEACRGYINKIIPPGVGTKVKISGSLVIDKSYGWAEIHPISKIEVITN